MESLFKRKQSSPTSGSPRISAELSSANDPLVCPAHQQNAMKASRHVLMKASAIAITFIFLAMGAGNVQAAAVYFLQIGDIKGESTDKSHKDWIDVDSFSWSVSNTGSAVSGGGTAAGKTTFSPFSWTQKLDRSVPPMLVGVASGKHYPQATLDVQQDAAKSPGVFFQMKFDDVLLTQLNIAGSNDRPDVAAALEFSKITMTYRPQNPDGSLGAPIVGGWDLKTNKFSGSAEALQGLFLAEPSPSAVPVPAAAWLLGSGLLGLVGVARRKKAGDDVKTL